MITLRFTLILFAATVVVAACGTSEADDALPSRAAMAAGSDGSATPTTAQRGDAATPAASDSCGRLLDFAANADAVNNVSFDDPDALRDAFEGLHADLVALQADPPTAEFEENIDAIVAAWVPWKELFARADYVFADVDPEEMQQLFEDTGLLDPGQFDAQARRFLEHGVEVCGLDATLAASLMGDDAAGADIDIEGGLVDTGAGISVVFEDQQFDMTDGFCGVGPDDILVGRFTDGTWEASFVGDVGGDTPEINSFTMVTAGSASGGQVEWTFDDESGLSGSFASGRFAGHYRCE